MKKTGILTAMILALCLQPVASQKIRKINMHSGVTISALRTVGDIQEDYTKAATGQSIGMGIEWFGNTKWSFTSKLDYATFGGKGVYLMTDISGMVTGQVNNRFDFHDLSIGGIFAYKRPQINYVPRVFAGPRIDLLVSSSRGGMGGINFGVDAGLGIAKTINNSVEFSLDLVYHQLFAPIYNGYYGGLLISGQDYTVRPKYFFTLQFGFNFYFGGLDAV